MEKVNYERLKPGEFEKRLKECPVAYLPLGTLEWHGTHMPLGADGLQSRGFFERLARKIGGIVFPMLFMGVDSAVQTENGFLYGMDNCGDNFVGNMKYESHQLSGSCYYIEEEAFRLYLLAIAKQVARAGFKVLVAHGHGPSVLLFRKLKEEIQKTYDLICLDCWNDEENYKLGLQVDHGGDNETSIMLAVDHDLVDMSLLPQDMDEWPLAIGMGDPRLYASEEKGEEIIRYQLERMSKIIYQRLGK